MRIFNLIASRDAGLTETAANYCEALRLAGHDVIAVAHPKTRIDKALAGKNIPQISFPNLGSWDVFAAGRLRREAFRHRPEAVIAHGHRALSLAARGMKGFCPIIGVADDDKARRLANVDAVFAPTQDLAAAVTAQGVPADRIFHIPSMVRCGQEALRRPRRDPPVIGAMGRFAAKKGFDVYIEALRLLKERGLRFQVVLGGAGDEEERLKTQALRAGLEGTLRFPGLVRNKREFFNAIDIFCLPSLHEPFGVVLLEAFAHGVPVVTTNTEGPLEIVTHCREALMVEKGSAQALADGLAMLLQDEAMAAGLARHAITKVREQYSMEVISHRMDEALGAIVNGGRKQQMRAAVSAQ